MVMPFDRDGTAKENGSVIGAGTPREPSDSEEMMHEKGHEAQGVSGLMRDLLDALHELAVLENVSREFPPVQLYSPEVHVVSCADLDPEAQQ